MDSQTPQQRCLGGYGNLVLPYSSNLQCGIQTLNSTQISSCCRNEPQIASLCYAYCEPKDDDFHSFVACISGGSDASKNDIRTDAFCQQNLIPQADGSIKGLTASSAVRGVRIPSTWSILTIALMSILLLVTPASASTNLKRRDSNNCNIQIASHYNTTGSQILLTPPYHCPRGGNSSSGFCTFGANVTTGYFNNNRTFNSHSAAEPRYDSFFDLLGQKTKPSRFFPAVSGLEVEYEWAAREKSDTRVTFIPVQYCVNGTLSGCGDVLPGGGDGHFEACGPEFRDGTGRDGGVIQGLFWLVYGG